MCQYFVNISNEALYDMHMSPSDATAFARQMVALSHYTQNNVSIRYCAKLPV